MRLPMAILVILFLAGAAAVMLVILLAGARWAGGAKADLPALWA